MSGQAAITKAHVYSPKKLLAPRHHVSKSLNETLSRQCSHLHGIRPSQILAATDIPISVIDSVLHCRILHALQMV